MSVRRILGDEAGIGAVEFALIAPVMLLLILGGMEFAYVSSARSTLEAAVIRGARAVAASDCPASREKLLQDTVDKAMEHIVSADGELPKIESKSYSGLFGNVGEPEPFVDDPANPNNRYDPGESFTDVNGNGQWDRDMGRSGSIGAAGQVVSYSATFNVRSLVPSVLKQFSTRDHYPIRASTVIRNEPVFRTTGCPK